MRRLAALLVLIAAAACERPEPEHFVVMAGPKDLSSVEVRDHAGTLWRIEAARPVTLAALDYGVVPPGFRQTVPADGSAPRPFRFGEPLTMRLVTAKRFFEHQGYADGPASWSIDSHEVRVIGKTITREEVAAGGIGETTADAGTHEGLAPAAGPSRAGEPAQGSNEDQDGPETSGADGS